MDLTDKCWIFLLFHILNGYNCQLDTTISLKPIYVNDKGKYFNSSEAWLHNDLFEDYNPKVRPMYESKDTVTVQIGMDLAQIRKLDQQNQILETFTFIHARWYDEMLVWDHKKYRQNRLIVPASEVWLPDFGVGNSAKDFYDQSWYENFHVRIASDGKVDWIFSGHFETVCAVDLTYYPFDTQKCSIKLKNSMYIESMVNLTLLNDKIMFSDYSQNGEWNIVETDCSRSLLSINPFESLPVVACEMTLERAPTYYLINLVIPSVILAVLVMFVNWLPAASGEKMGFSVTVLLAYYVLQLTISDAVPKDSAHTPIMSLVIAFIMCLSCLSVMMQIIMLYIYLSNHEKRVPALAKNIILKKLAVMLCMGKQTLKVEDVQRSKVQIIQQSSIKENDGKTNVDSVKDFETNPDASGVNHQLLQLLENMALEKDRERRKDNIDKEWKAVAAVLDRCFFWVTLIALIVASVVMFFPFGV